MIFTDKVAIVVGLAKLVEDLSPTERRAILDVAHRLDTDRNRMTSTNRRWDPERGTFTGGPSVLALDLCEKESCRMCSKTLSIVNGTHPDLKGGDN